MNPKDKAIELFTKMKGFRVKHSHSNKCAKIAVNHIIEELKEFGTEDGYSISRIEFYTEVLNELEKI